MTIISTTASDSANCQAVSPEINSSYSQDLFDKSRFDRLFETVFDSMKMQELVGNADVSNILNTIANITNYHSK